MLLPNLKSFVQYLCSSVVSVAAQTDFITPLLPAFIAASRSCRPVKGEGCCDLSGEVRLAGSVNDAACWAVPIRHGTVPCAPEG